MAATKASAARNTRTKKKERKNIGCWHCSYPEHV